MQDMQDFLLYALGLGRPKKDGLASKTHVDLYDYGLSGPQGAEVAIKQINITPNVTHINLGHNPLGDIGLSTIIDYLCLTENSFPIEELNLNDCGIGDSGLSTISRYIEHNRELRRLYLAGNRISGWGSPVIIKAFAKALNNSRVQTNLGTPHLRDLQLSRVGLTQSSLPIIEQFLTSPACYGLRSLHLNANALSNKGLKGLVARLLTSNTTLCSMQAFANGLSETVVIDGSEEVADGALLETTLHALSLVLARNAVNLAKVAHEAKSLLLVSRSLLLARRRSESKSGYQLVFPWRKLAPELQHYILRFLAVTLSDAQIIRICNYAANNSTLPPLFPQLGPIKSKEEHLEDYLIAVGCNRFESA